uniref:uncharacterized protein LOC117248448 isoform X1 n=1 Tax=Epinephelus lanceolatus TaxID=310571 RepID=UPI0014457441|nr:uncharacterized protein LOC117248448 isoform X1 [Epinephelus lanceolatus]
MSWRCFNQPWLVLDRIFNHPAGHECYTVRATDCRFPENADMLVSRMESELWDDFSPEEKDPVYPNHQEWWFSTLSSPLDLPLLFNASLRSPATSWSPPHRALRTRFVPPNQWRTRKAAAWQPYKTRQYHGWRPSVSMQGGCGCNCGPRRYRQRRWRPRRCQPERYRPRVTSSEHLPVAIQPTKWYQVVGSMQCSNCKAQGRHQMTSWMCQRCEVPLCLKPYRNCYTKWHGQGCELRGWRLPFQEERQ